MGWSVSPAKARVAGDRFQEAPLLERKPKLTFKQPISQLNIRRSLEPSFTVKFNGSRFLVSIFFGAEGLGLQGGAQGHGSGVFGCDSVARSSSFEYRAIYNKKPIGDHQKKRDTSVISMVCCAKLSCQYTERKTWGCLF